MVYTRVLLLVACLPGLEAANLLRGTAATAATEKVSAGGSDVVKKGKASILSDIAAKTERFVQNPQNRQQTGNSLNSYIRRVCLQMIFGVFYWFMIVKHYPMLNHQTPTKRAIELQSMNDVVASCSSKMSVPNFLCAWCCTGPRAAQTFHAVDVMNYWFALVLMSTLPCCTLCMVNAYTDLNEKLGGEKEDAFTSCLCSCFCAPCVVAKDAQSLDEIMDVQSEVYGFSIRR